MTRPRRVKLSRKAGARKPPDAVTVARPSRWGNPFVMGQPDPRSPTGEPFTRASSVDAYRTWIAGDAPSSWTDAVPASHDEIRAELAGKDLACWCPPDEPCHADVLLTIANR